MKRASRSSGAPGDASSRSQGTPAFKRPRTSAERPGQLGAWARRNASTSRWTPAATSVAPPRGSMRSRHTKSCKPGRCSSALGAM
jgi:hypothetical protein